MNFASLIKSEFRKLVYSRTTWGLLLGAIALAVLSAAVQPLAITKQTKALVGMSITDVNVVNAIFVKATAGYLFAMILGAVFITTEFTKGTAVASFLAAPKRSSVVMAKMVVVAGAGLVLQIIATACGVTGALIALSNYPEAAKPDSIVFLEAGVVAVITGVVFAIIGTALGSLLRNTVVSVVSILIWMNLVEPLLLLFWKSGSQFFLTSLISGIMQLHLGKAGSFISTGDFLDPIPAALTLFIYGLAFAGISFATTLRRDIE